MPRARPVILRGPRHGFVKPHPDTGGVHRHDDPRPTAGCAAVGLGHLIVIDDPGPQTRVGLHDQIPRRSPAVELRNRAVTKERYRALIAPAAPPVLSAVCSATPTPNAPAPLLATFVAILSL
jgi:hypothetical protein